MKAENHLVEEVIEAIRTFIREERITMEELDNKVYRILNLKYEYGLFGPAENTGEPEKVLQDKAMTERADREEPGKHDSGAGRKGSCGGAEGERVQRYVLAFRYFV